MKRYSIRYVWNRLLKKARGVAILNSTIAQGSKIGSGSQLINSTLGKHSYCGYDCKVINCQIGNFTSIADNVIIGGLGHPYLWVSTSPVFYKDKSLIKKKFQIFDRNEDLITLIGNDVWVGEGVYIKAGIEIGDGAVIGMGSVVTKNVSPYAIVVGAPAKEIKKRFDDKICEELIKTQWWNFSDEKISIFSKFIRNPQLFVNNIIQT